MCVFRKHDECSEMRDDTVFWLPFTEASHCDRSVKLSPISSFFVFDIPGSPWSCLGCGKTVGVSKINSIVNSALKIIGTKRDENNEVLLETIEKLEQALHHNHYLIIGLKEIIIQRLMRNIRKKTGIYEKILNYFSFHLYYKLSTICHYLKCLFIDFRKSYRILQPQNENV